MTTDDWAAEETDDLGYAGWRNSSGAECCSAVSRGSVSGSTSAAPPQTSQRHWPLPWHLPQIPMMTPAKDLPPEPLQLGQAIVLWP